jgi:hypothetical protein
MLRHRGDEERVPGGVGGLIVARTFWLKLKPFPHTATLAAWAASQ